MLLVSTLLCTALYVGMFLALRNEVDSFLVGEVNEFLLKANSYVDDYTALERDIRQELGVRTRRDLSFRLFDEHDQLLVSSDAADALAPLWSSPAGWNTETPRYLLQTLQPDSQPYPWRVCSLRVTRADGRIQTMQASYVLDRMVGSLATFRKVCVVVLTLIAVVAIATGRLLARRSLRPIQTMTAIAEQIEARSLHERIPLSGTGDEMDRLAGTLNNMFNRIERHVSQVHQFTADASHELRTPLAALRGHAEVILARPRSNAELREAIESSVEHYIRLQRIADDLLLLARLDSGEDVLRREATRLDAAIEDVIDLYGPVAEDAQVELRAAIDGPATVWADPGRVRQLISNLVDNAIKFTGPDGKITIALEVLNGHADVRVADNGIGIPKEDLPRIFDRFYQVNRARSGRDAGVGLGLAICRSVAQAHGGRLEIRSQQGEGTCVTLRLPIHMEPDK